MWTICSMNIDRSDRVHKIYTTIHLASKIPHPNVLAKIVIFFFFLPRARYNGGKAYKAWIEDLPPERPAPGRWRQNHWTKIEPDGVATYNENITATIWRACMSLPYWFWPDCQLAHALPLSQLFGVSPKIAHILPKKASSETWYTASPSKDLESHWKPFATTWTTHDDTSTENSIGLVWYMQTLKVHIDLYQLISVGILLKLVEYQVFIWSGSHLLYIQLHDTEIYEPSLVAL